MLSLEGFNYHFALMEPPLQSKGNKMQSVAFKIKENSTNWLAVGICQKSVVVGNGFNFSYSTLGHGAFMISSNGGTTTHYGRFMVIHKQHPQQRRDKLHLCEG
jgi:hypothetical protein